MGREAGAKEWEERGGGVITLLVCDEGERRVARRVGEGEGKDGVERVSHPLLLARRVGHHQVEHVAQRVLQTEAFSAVTAWPRKEKGPSVATAR